VGELLNQDLAASEGAEELSEEKSIPEPLVEEVMI
jgi:hypothetical protein